MEEEKKNQNNTEHKNRPHHKRGYFITPDNNASSPVSKPTDNKANENTSSGDKTNKEIFKNKNRRNRQRHHNRPQNTDNLPQPQEKKQDTSTLNDVPDQKNSENTQRNNHNHNHKHKKNNRNHHQSHRAEKQDIDVSEIKVDTQPIVQQEDKYEEVVLTSETDEPIIQQEQEEVPLVEVVGIKFKSSGKTYYFDPQGKSYQKGGYAIVETARGLEYGEISLGNTMVKETDTVPPI